MDRRQRKTRTAIMNAFCELLSKKHYDKITVGEIIEMADVGRATFYAHFETKDFLLRELCHELFCHIFDTSEFGKDCQYHIFQCDTPPSAFLHLIQHLQKNDNNILCLLSCENNELFLRYFKENLKKLIKSQRNGLCDQKPAELPDSLWLDHIAACFVETVRWWSENGMKETPEELSKYFTKILFPKS